MKRKIDGKIYDTDTAKEIACYDNNESDLDFLREVLYRKRTGEFFLFGEGGARTKYSEQRGNNRWGSGAAITPLDYSAAQEWCEHHTDTDTYETLFGEIGEEGEKCVFAANLPEALLVRTKRAASQAGISISALMEKALNEYLQQREINGGMSDGH